MAAIAERPELEKQALLYMVLPESILIISVGIAYLLLSKI
jgi:F0F1-type ATP synthase membrane subunit c/vacuolar-type H+-ATPase subunit K